MSFLPRGEQGTPLLAEQGDNLPQGLGLQLQPFTQASGAEEAGITAADRPTVAAARAVTERTGTPAVAIQLPDGHIVTGKTSSLLGASSAALLNALKYLARIPDKIDLISPEVIAPKKDDLFVAVPGHSCKIYRARFVRDRKRY